MCATFVTIVITNNDLARGYGTYESPYKQGVTKLTKDTSQSGIQILNFTSQKYLTSQKYFYLS